MVVDYIKRFDGEDDYDIDNGGDHDDSNSDNNDDYIEAVSLS